MARLIIGEKIKIEAQLPMVEESSKEVSSEEQTSGLDVLALIEKAISMLPKPEATKEIIVEQKEVDLSHLCTKSDMSAVTSSVITLCDQYDDLERRVDLISSGLDELHERKEDASAIIVPEIKQITHIKDVSSDVLKECKERIQQTEINIMLKIGHLQKENMKQKRINLYLLCGMLIAIGMNLI